MNNENDDENIILSNNKLEDTIQKKEGPKIKDEYFTNFIKNFSLYMYCAKPLPFNNKLYTHICKIA